MVGAIIFSRFSSSRLPGKALMDINGRTLLGRVIDRAKLINGVAKVIVATSTLPSDDVIAAYAEAEGVSVFRGSLDDVASRAVGACEAFGLDAFSRICGDRPFFDPQIQSRLINLFQGRDLDLATTNGVHKIPPGLTGEIVRLSALKGILEELHDFDREHVTSFFYTSMEKFKVKAISVPDYVLSKYADISLVVDNANDLERARWIAARVSEQAVEMPRILSLAHQWEQQHKAVEP